MMKIKQVYPNTARQMTPANGSSEEEEFPISQTTYKYMTYNKINY